MGYHWILSNVLKNRHEFDSEKFVLNRPHEIDAGHRRSFPHHWRVVLNESLKVVPQLRFLCFAQLWIQRLEN